MKGDLSDITKRKAKLEERFYPLSMDLDDRPSVSRVLRFFEKYRDFYERRERQTAISNAR